MIYHQSIGFPKNFCRPVGRAVLTLTHHVREQSVERGIVLPSHIDFRSVKIIEAGYDNGRLSHLLLRMSYNSEMDICIPVALKYGKFVAKTVWLCDVNDDHSTLDHSKYSQP